MMHEILALELRRPRRSAAPAAGPARTPARRRPAARERGHRRVAHPGRRGATARGTAARPAYGAAAGADDRACGSVQAASRTGRICHHGANSGRRKRTRLSRSARGGLAPACGGRSSCIICFGGVLGCLRSSEASRVVSSKSNLVSQSSGEASIALRNSSSARLSQPSRASGCSSTVAFWKNAHAAQKLGRGLGGAFCATSITSS